MSQDSANIVYIAGNKYLHTSDGVQVLKLGITGNLDGRMTNLSQPTGVPGRFVVYYAVSFPTRERARQVEQTLLNATFHDYRLTDNNGNLDDSEFLTIPLTKLMATLSILSDAKEMDLQGNPLAEDDEDDEQSESIVQAGNRRRIGVKEIGIQVGEELMIKGTSAQGYRETKVKVVRAEYRSQVEWNGQYLPLSTTAAKIRNAKGNINGWLYFQYEDPEHGRESLFSRRERWEREGLLK